MLEYNPEDQKIFQEYLDAQEPLTVPLVEWGETHCRIAKHFAEWYMRKQYSQKQMNSAPSSFKSARKVENDGPGVGFERVFLVGLDSLMTWKNHETA